MQDANIERQPSPLFPACLISSSPLLLTMRPPPTFQASQSEPCSTNFTIKMIKNGATNGLNLKSYGTARYTVTHFCPLLLSRFFFFLFVQ